MKDKSMMVGYYCGEDRCKHDAVQNNAPLKKNEVSMGYPLIKINKIQV